MVDRKLNVAWDDARALVVPRSVAGELKSLRNKVFEHEKRTSLKVLEQLHTQLSEMIPPDPDMELRRQLEEAIQEEDYESAAKLRDQLEDVDDHPEG